MVPRKRSSTASNSARVKCGATGSDMRRAFAIISIGSPPELDSGVISLLAGGEELRQARGAAHHQRQDARGHRIQRA